MNYPKGSKIKQTKSISYGNRGSGLEEEINLTNEYYLVNRIANIHKKPVSITINTVDYPSRREAVIKEAYFKTPSTTDYNGIYKGHYIDFEAKEIRSKTSFPLSNIHSHQLKHLQSILSMGGIGFVLVKFSLLDETYYLDGKDLFSFLETESRKSIPYSYFKEKGYLIKTKYMPRIDYLEIIEHIYFIDKG